MYADFFIINWLIEFKPIRSVGDLGEKNVKVALVYSVKLSCVKVFGRTHGGSLAFISEGNLNRSDQGAT